MKNKLTEEVGKFRIIFPGRLYCSDETFGNNGAFEIKRGKDTFVIISSDGFHLSVHVRNKKGKNRCPTWKEMCWIKDLFFDEKDLFFEEEENIIQIHPAKENYVNIHPYVLHMWRCQNERQPLPPLTMV